MAWTVSGAVVNNGIAIAGVQMRLERNDTGALLDAKVTGSNGAYELGTTFVGVVKLWMDKGGDHEDSELLESDGSSATNSSIGSPPPNNNPALGTVSNVSYTENSGTQTADVTATDADSGDTFSNNFTKVSGPSWFTTTVVDGTPPGSYRRHFNTNGVAPGNYSAGMRANDDWAGLGTTKNFTITITPANNAPVLVNPGTKNFFNNSGIQQFQLVATDDDDDPLTFSKTSGQSWGTTNSSGLVSINTDLATRGGFSFRWKVDDGTDDDSESHTININNNDPVIEDPGGIEFVSNQGPLTYQLLYNDADGDTVTFSKTAGDALATVSSSGLITVDTDNIDGAYSITVEGDDGNGGTDSLVIPITLTTPAPAPEVWVIT